MDLGISISKHTLSFSAAHLCSSCLLLDSRPPHSLLKMWPIIAVAPECEVHSGMCRQRVCVCVCVCVCVYASSVESYLEQAMFVAVLAEPHSTAWGELHLWGVYHPLINPADDKSEENVWL